VRGGIASLGLWFVHAAPTRLGGQKTVADLHRAERQDQELREI